MQVEYPNRKRVSLIPALSASNSKHPQALKILPEATFISFHLARQLYVPQRSPQKHPETPANEPSSRSSKPSQSAGRLLL